MSTTTPTVTEITGRALHRAATLLRDYPDGLAPEKLWPLVRDSLPELVQQWEAAIEGYRTSFELGCGRSAAVMVKAGWLRRGGSQGWKLTGLGVEALDEHKSPDEFYRAALNADDYWQRHREDFDKAGRLLDLIPDDRWAALSDFAALYGLDDRRLAGWLQTERPSGWHRVLGEDASIPAGTFGMSQQDRDEWRMLLQTDGLFDEAHSSQDRIRALVPARLPRAELEAVRGAGQLLDTEAERESGLVPRRAWMIRGTDATGASLIRSHWRHHNICSLPTQGIKPLPSRPALGAVRAAIASALPGRGTAELNSLTQQFHDFLTVMAEDDIVLCNDATKVYVGVVQGPARWHGKESEQETPSTWVQRPVAWHNLDDPAAFFADLPTRLIDLLDDPNIDVIELSEFTADLQRLLGEPGDPQRAEAAETPAELPNITEELAHELMLRRDWLQDCIELLRRKPQLVFFGPPGTGKTHLVQELAKHLTGGRPENTQLVQFHPAYSYEDFFEGIRPRLLPTADDHPRSGAATQQAVAGDHLGFELVRGPLRRLADAALKHPAQVFVLIIDEMNRGNLAKVFGELYFLLDYRDRSVRLMYGADGSRNFRLPPNLVILGTMNSADRSIALMDGAMRRRFSFLELHPDEGPAHDLLATWSTRREHPDTAARLLTALNEAIAESRGTDRDFRIGPSYFMDDAIHRNSRGLELVWRTQILPLLAEYHWGDHTDIESTYGLHVLLKRIGLNPSADDA
ncbi:AAA family ATPase [Kitasatospora sp. NPDC057738]|uniref:AAA family ATPase n=1 Tax=Kitasatospora sp. NPDC057738 TaxID=3346233 RepID=UPI00367DFDC9